MCDYSLLYREELSLEIMMTKKSGPKLALKSESLTIPVFTLSTSHTENLQFPEATSCHPQSLECGAVFYREALRSLGYTVESPGKLKKTDPRSHSEIEGQDSQWHPTNNDSNRLTSRVFM